MSRLYARSWAALRLLATWKNTRATTEPLPPVWGTRK
jgi:hypothetical protein